MFAKATKNFVREIDSEGDWIPVSRLNNLDKMQFLNLVMKKKKTWCWQKPKYQLLSVTLNDVLAEDEPIKPVVVDTDFVKYEGKFEDYVKGSIETSFGRINLGAGGRSIVESQSSFGNLKKQEADLQKLMKDAQGRTINLQHTLLQQMLERKHGVLCILTERILTTKKCVISEHIQTEEKLASMVSISKKIIKVSVSEDGNVIKDSNVILEIPAATAIAYSVIELYIKHDGQFEFCLLNERQGGFEKGSTEGPSPHSLVFRDVLFPYYLDAVDNEKQANPEGPIPSGASLSILNKERKIPVVKETMRGQLRASRLFHAESLKRLEDALQFKKQFQHFMKLSEQEQGALYGVLCDLLLQDEMVLQLEELLDNICSEDNPELGGMTELKPLEHPKIEQFLQLLGINFQDKWSMQKQSLHNKELLLATHILLSAVAELPDYALFLLRACCDLHVVPTLCCLPNITSMDGTLKLPDPLLVPLTDPRKFHIVQRLFALSNINLEMTESSIRVVTMKKPRFFPIILYIALYGLCALSCKTAEA